MASRSRLSRKRKPRSLWFEKLMAIVAILDVGFVLFDLSYVPWRDVYYRYLPEAFHETYDKIKGIEPHRDTQQYLELVENLEEQVAATGVQSPQVEPILQELRQQSVATIDENPFQIANKTGTLEKIKNEMRDRMDEESAKDAFRQFWSQDHLTPQTWRQEIQFFNKEIARKMETNYYRSLSVRGTFTDRFWLIDIWFIGLFGLEFIARTWLISRRVGIPWKEAWLFRWYDIFWLVPFSGLGVPLLGLSRIVPLVFRLDQSELVNLKPLRAQINQGIVAALAGEITETVVIRIIDQLQDAIEEDAIANFLQSPKPQYIDLNNVNEIEVLSNRFVNLSVYEVLPRIKPDLEALLHHSITVGLKGTAFYTSIQSVPGLKDAPDRIAKELVEQITDTLYSIVRGAIEDPVGAKLFENLVQKFADSLGSEVGKPENIDEIQVLLSDFLEEVKINYVRRAEIEDIEAIVQESKRLREAAQK
ncbi:hypothetical protein [Baaleninema sp.]|uniref:hypothetical protein n=1 Tax=Baaleninema sp. TaxID=3101197 RepID=UPI003D009604